MKDISFLKNKLIAHRGLYNELIPENSIKAFENAINKDYIIELDVHLINDGNVVVFHDDNLKRMTGLDKNIKDCTYDELQQLKLKDTKYTIPLFSDVLKLINGKVPVIVELKYDNKVGLLEDKVIKMLNDYKYSFAVKSFSVKSIRYINKHASNFIKGLLITHKNHKILNKLILNKFICDKYLGIDFLSCSIKLVKSKKIKKLRNNKIILGWTVRKSNVLDEYKNYCDNLICEKIL